MVGMGDYSITTAFSKKKGCGITVTASSMKWLFCSRGRGTVQKYGGE